MEIIQFIKCILKIGGILPVFSNGNQYWIARLLEVIKMFIVIFSSTYTTITLFVFGIVYMNDINQSTISFYQGIGFGMGVIVHLSMWSQTKAIQILFDNIENMVNMSKSNQMYLFFFCFERLFIAFIASKESRAAHDLAKIMKKLTKT